MKRTTTLIPKLARLLALAATGLLPLTAAHANHLEDVCTRSDSTIPDQSIYIPIQLDYNDRDVKVGEAYGPWFKHHITWTCERRHDVAHPGSTFAPLDDYFEVRTRYYLDGAMQNGDFLAADPSYRIYHHGPTIGVIARITQQIDDQPAQTTPLNAPIGRVTTTEFKGSVARKVGDISEFHFTLEVRMVRQKEPPFKGAIPLFLVNNFDTTNRYDHHGYHGHHDHHDKRIFIQRSHMYNYLPFAVNHVKAACKTPDQTVQLGTALMTALQGAGSAGPQTGFNLRFEQCPLHRGAIDYELKPVHGQVKSVPGTLELAPAASATGVGVQVLLADGITPVTFNQTYPLTAYDPGNTDPAVVYQVPLHAQIVRTDGPLNGGTVEAAMNLVTTYR